MTVYMMGQPVLADIMNLNEFKRIPPQFIAALGDPDAGSGNNAHSWGLWRLDPGPRGVWLDNFEQLKAAGGLAPAKWQFDGNDWWLEEHGLIMESPDFPVPAGRYVVTGDREVVSILTIHAMDSDGNQHWALANGATLFDVTHLPCRSARYTPIGISDSCSPNEVEKSAFPVSPGAPMPAVGGCHKQDYAVLVVIGLAVDQ